jgi:transposase-like protein
MPNPYSMELRDRAVRAYETGDAGYTTVAKQFGVDRATLIRWVQRARRTGSAALQRSRELTRRYSRKRDHRIAAPGRPVKGKLASLVTFGDA